VRGASRSDYRPSGYCWPHDPFHRRDPREGACSLGATYKPGRIPKSQTSRKIDQIPLKIENGPPSQPEPNIDNWTNWSAVTAPLHSPSRCLGWALANTRGCPWSLRFKSHPLPQAIGRLLTKNSRGRPLQRHLSTWRFAWKHVRRRPLDLAAMAISIAQVYLPLVRLGLSAPGKFPRQPRLPRVVWPPV
jgi:hypothetical protein